MLSQQSCSCSTEKYGSRISPGYIKLWYGPFASKQDRLITDYLVLSWKNAQLGPKLWSRVFVMFEVFFMSSPPFL